ncbi:MAG: hypothetical protein JST84_12890 [Acidobacteria bacterium]|nr:hypothetical protein [Acidobacteriota bacterium]
MISVTDIAKDFDTLQASDFDDNIVDSNGMERLRQLTGELSLLSLKEKDISLEIMFKLMERLADSDLGSPGPLVHTIEKIPDYEQALFKSVGRKPTPLNLWMLNRVLNTSLSEAARQRLLSMLQDSLSHPLASTSAKEEAQTFLDFQNKRSA